MTVQIGLMIAVTSSIISLCGAATIMRIRKRLIDRKWDKLNLDEKLKAIEVKGWSE